MIDFNLIKDLKINNQSVTQLQIGQSIIWKRNVEPVDEDIELEYVSSNSSTSPKFPFKYHFDNGYTLEVEVIQSQLVSTERSFLSDNALKSPFEVKWYQYGRYTDFHKPLGSTNPLCGDPDYSYRQMITGSTYRVSGETNLQTYQFKVSGTSLSTRLLVNGSQKFNTATTITNFTGKWYEGEYEGNLYLAQYNYIKSLKVYDNNNTLLNHYIFKQRKDVTDKTQVYLYDKIKNVKFENELDNPTYSYIFKEQKPINVEYQMSDLVYTNTVDGVTTSSTINFTGTTINTYECGVVETTQTISSITKTYNLNLSSEPIIISGQITWNGITKPYSITQNPFDTSKATAIAYDANDNIIWATTATTNIVLPTNLSSQTYKVSLPKSSISLGQSAFTRTNITELITPNNCTIDNDAFQGCSKLQTLVLGNNNTIKRGSFSSCIKLTSLILPDNTKITDWGTFLGCTSLTSITFNDNVQITATSYLFSGCTNLNTIYCNSYFAPTIHSKTFQYINPNGVLHIPQGSTQMYSTMMSSSNYYLGLYNWTVKDDIEYNPTKMIIHYNVTSTTAKTKVAYSTSIFNNKAIWINDKTIPERLTSTGYTFTELGDNKIEIDNVTRIGESSDNYGVFKSCSNIISVIIPDGVTSIGYGSFDGCSSLTSVTIPDSVTSIATYVFYGCKSLTSVTIPDGITSIEKSTFGGCSSLTSVTIPDSVTIFDQYVFSSCSSLTSITYNGTIQEWNAIPKGSNWKNGVPSTCVVHCTDGDTPI